MKKPDFLKKYNFSYIPLIGNSKIAAVSGWHKYSDSKSEFSVDELMQSNVGIVTGTASDLLIADIDNPNLFASYLRRNGFKLNKDFLVKTGKGYHSYHRYPNDSNTYGCKQYQIYGFDIRGTGGYIVAPYSTHPDTGKEYSIVAEGEIGEAPDWLKRYSLGVDRSSVPNLEKIPNDAKNLICNGVEVGRRSEAMLKAINAMLLSKFDDDQIFYVFNTYPIGEKYLEKPDNIRDGWLQEQIDKCRETLIVPSDVKNSEKLPDIAVVNGVDLLNKDCECRWLVDGLIEECGHTLITGKSGIGKSLFTLNLALALASQQDFMGHKVVMPLNVAIIQCENSEPFMKHRLNKMVEACPEYKGALERIRFIYFNGRHDNPAFRLSNSNLELMVEKIYELSHPHVIVIDPYKSYAGTVENSNDENREVLDRLFAVLNKYNTTALIIHHEGRANDRFGVDRARGASAVTDAISNYWSVYRKDDKESDTTHFVVRCEKARNAKKFDELYLEIVDNFYFKYNPNPHDPRRIADIVEENGGSVGTQKELVQMICNRLEVKELKAKQLLKDALSSNYIAKEKYGQNRIKYSSIITAIAA